MYPSNILSDNAPFEHIRFLLHPFHKVAANSERANMKTEINRFLHMFIAEAEGKVTKQFNRSLRSGEH